MGNWFIAHSAKGSTWEEHKYIKRLDGVYYYPDSYEGGRHLPKGDSAKNGDGSGTSDEDRIKAGADLVGAKESAIRDLLEIGRTKGFDSPEFKEECWGLSAGDDALAARLKQALTGSGATAKKSNLEDWEKKMHQHIGDIVEKNPEMFKTTDDVKKHLMSDANTDAFKKTLKAITGMDTDKMSDDEIKKMRNKLNDYYAGSSGSSGKSSAKKSSGKEKTSEDKEDKEKKEKKSGGSSDSSKKTRVAVDKNVYYGGRAKHSDILEHHGILGMKWGVRRYQNRDGTLTAAGRRRLGQISDSNRRVGFNKDTGKLDQGLSNYRNAKSAIHQNVAADYQNTGIGLKAVGEATNRAGNIARDSGRRAKQRMASNMDISRMSDKELRDMVNRMNLEKQYKYLKTEDIVTGRERAADILGIIGSVAAIGASAAAIAGVVYQIKG